MTQLEAAKNSTITPLVKKVSRLEGINEKLLSEGIKSGRIVIPLNRKRSGIARPCAVGWRMRTKVNANIGTSTDKASQSLELKKLKAAVKYGADTVMDLSTGGNLRKIRNEIVRRSPIPVGTVPIYEVAVNAQKRRGGFLNFTINEILEVLEDQAAGGVDFFTIHAGITEDNLKLVRRGKRILDIVSRGGSIIAGWMSRYRKENPFYEYFDRIVDIAAKYDVTLSLGDGLRPGSVLDATDGPQIAELKILGQLADVARKKNVQVMIEGPGHVPINQVEKNVYLEKKFCRGAPFYVLGPLVTDIAAGYDHISSAIGGALAASAGADFLCYVTASEHLRHPPEYDVGEAVVTARIAAHAADIAKKIPGAIEWDKKMSLARRQRDWKKQIALSIDSLKAKQFRKSSLPDDSGVCTMCGKYCSIKLTQDCLRV